MGAFSRVRVARIDRQTAKYFFVLMAIYQDNFMEAKEMAHEALQGHLDWMAEDGDEIPESTLRISEEDCIAVGIKVLV